MEKIKRFYQKNKFPIYLFIFSFILRLIIITIINTPIISDFKTMYDASIELINHTGDYNSKAYFIYWGYQMGHVIYQYLLLLIWKSPLFLKIINSLITSLIVVMIYLISKKVSSNISSKIISVFYSIFLFPLLLNTVLTNQHFPLLLILISLYILLNISYDDKYILKSIIIGILLSLSNILRGETIVIIVGIFIYLVYLAFNKIKIKRLLLSFILIFTSYLVVFNTSSYLLKVTNISVNGLENKNTEWKFVTGLNIKTNGMYSDEDAEIYAYNKEASKEVTIERLKNYKELPLLFLKKVKVLWINSDLSWSIGHIENKTLYNLLTIINQIFIIIIHLLSLVSVVNFIQKKFDKTQILITSILIVYFFVYLLIEVMPRYAYSLQAIEIILATIGLDIIINFFKRKVSVV